MITRVSKEDVCEHLRQLGVRSGMGLVVHSKLMSFGVVKNAESLVFECLQEVVGPKGTIVVPTYTFSTSETVVYDPKNTPSTNVGRLGEFVREQPGAVRSLSPIHNHAALGPKADVLMQTPPTASLGPQSDFENLSNAGFSLLLLGCKFSEGCTFLHHMEAMENVPYRRWVDVERHYVDPADGLSHDVMVKYFARDDDGWTENLDVVEAPLIELGAVVQVPTLFGASRFMALKDLEAYAHKILNVDAYALVKAVEE